ncbi:hypothetical protein [Clostridium sp. BJN0013]
MESLNLLDILKPEIIAILIFEFDLIREVRRNSGKFANKIMIRLVV